MTTTSSAVLLLRLLPLLLLSACLQDVRGDIESGSGDANLPSTCRPEFQKLKDHTMCLHDSEAVTQSGVSDEDKQIIVDLHNQLRAGVKPTATNMRKVIWDDKIAEIAQKWTMQCVVDHDKNRNVPSYSMGIGQNAAGGYGSWRKAVMGWYNEVTMFKYGQDPEVYIGKDGWMKIGHYTQVVQADTDRIGCGFAVCGGRKYYICNYGPGQQNIQKPYKSGETCAACPDSCHNNLCAKPPAVFTSAQGCEYPGQRASAEECKQYGNKGKDTFACITQGGNWGCDECIAYANVKTEYCPVTCGLCDP